MASTLPILSNESHSLRVAVIENCQFSCPYCLPGSVKPIAKKYTWLAPEKYNRLCQALAFLPISKVRFTGGEPLLRQELCEIVDAFKINFPQATLSLTTNGQYLEKNLVPLIEAGISRINIHIDSLQPQKYKKIMGNADVDKILSFLPIAQGLLKEIKINVVLQKGINDDELADFLNYSITTGIQVRFIELMNTGSAQNYVAQSFLSGQDALNIVSRSFDFFPSGRVHKSDPAQLYQLKEFPFQFGLIASDTQPFCENCNRLRLSVQGELRGCLYQPKGLQLGKMINDDVSFEQLRADVRAAVVGKKSFHPIATKSNPNFSMSEIGG